MSYRDEEKKIQWKLRRIKSIAFTVIFLITVAICVFSAFVPPATWKYYFYLPSLSARGSGELRLHFIDVGQGDSTLIELPDGKTLLVDGGNGTEESTTAIMRYLNALKIEYLDYVLLTHTDSDHCGGLDTVLRYKKVGCVYYPEESNANVNAEYASFYKTLADSGVQKKFNRRGFAISSATYRLAWLWPYGADNQSSNGYEGNENSLVLYLQYAGKKALLMGDAPQRVEQRLCADNESGFLANMGVDIRDVDLLKASHHGSSNGNSVEFLAYTRPKTAVISCGKDNLYGHPHAETLERFAPYASVLRTDTQGNLMTTWYENGENSIKTGF